MTSVMRSYEVKKKRTVSDVSTGRIAGEVREVLTETLLLLKNLSSLSVNSGRTTRTGTGMSLRVMMVGIIVFSRVLF